MKKIVNYFTTVISFCLAAVAAYKFFTPTPPQDETENYISNFSFEKYTSAGTDYLNKRYSPERLNKPLNQIDTTYDFDFNYLDEITKKLMKVDRPKTLASIFKIITQNYKSNTGKHLAVIKFLQMASHNNSWMQPMYRDRQAVFDPLVLLELGIMRCGGVARLGADLFHAAGYTTRLVQAISHISAEVHYDGAWHLLEADLLGGGHAPMKNGKILSTLELSRYPEEIDKFPAMFEALINIPTQKWSGNVQSRPYPSTYFFSKEGYKNAPPSFLYKTATPQQAANSKWFGWNYFRKENDEQRILSSQPTKYEPSLTKIKSVIQSGDGVLLEWEESDDADNDLLGYRVYVASYSRGWNYPYFAGNANLKKYWKGGWKSEMYESLFREPPKDINLVKTKTTKVELLLPQKSTSYITIMPMDKYGESIGRKLYNMSNELVIRR